MREKTFPGFYFNNPIRFILIVILCQLLTFSSYSERVYSVVFHKLPQDHQLYPRDANNEANVPISGIIEVPDYNYMSVQVFRNDVLVKYLKAEIKYDGKGIGSFSTSTKIKAELAEYSFKVFARKSADSVLIIHRQNVVSGDAYLISGQSNSTGFFNESATSEYCRSFGVITDNLNTSPYNPADTLWALSNQKKAMVGTMGLELQKQLAEKTGIPNCVINGGFHWSSSFAHAIRTADNPADLTNGYGRMLYRVEKAGLKEAVKAFIFRQGESEAYHEGSDWEGNFDKLRKNLHLDLPNLKMLYVFQIDIIYYASPIGAMVRDYQRRLPEIYPDVKSLATVGTTGFDGLHYTSEGYRQNGQELARLVERDFYQLQQSHNINSPAVKKVFYSNEDKKQLIISFDEGQELIYPDKYKPDYSPVTFDMKDFFFLNHNAGAVVSGKAEENRIKLELSGSQNASILNYLPSYIADAAPFYRYSGPYITNKLGMRAFSFFEFPIGVALKKPTLEAKSGENRNVNLSWTEVSGAKEYILERKTDPNAAYQYLAKVSAPGRSYEDKSLPSAEKIYYRLKAASDISESLDYGYAESDSEIILGVTVEETSLFSVFPNPVSAHQDINIRFKNPVKGTISLLNQSGVVVKRQQVNQVQEVKMSGDALPPSIYFLYFKSEGIPHVRKLVIY
jgi:hypothetical protein